MPQTVLRCTFALLCAGSTVSARAEPDRLVFAPAPGIRADITRAHTAAGQTVTITLHIPGGATSRTIEVDSKKPLDIAAVDLDFDGHRDLSISHVDDGQGVYTLYDIYLYAPRERRFVRARPTCGEAFINLTVERDKRRLRNAYFAADGWRTCSMRLRQSARTHY